MKRRTTTLKPARRSLVASALLGELARAYRRTASAATTRPKFPHIQACLVEVLRTTSPHTRLPSIRQMARVLRTTVVPVQRAVTDLIRLNVLYARTGVGLFTREQQPPVLASNTNPIWPATSSLTFLAYSAAPFHRHMWDRLTTTFVQNNPQVVVQVIYDQSPAPSARGVDIMECSGWGYQRQVSEFPLLALRPFAVSSPTESAPILLNDYIMPLFFITHALIYNVEALRTHHLPLPTYQTFAEQIAYLHGLADAVQRGGRMESIVCAQQPFTWLGRYLTQIINLAIQGSERSAPLEQATRLITDITTLWRRFQRQGPLSQHGQDAIRAFIDQEAFCCLGTMVHAAEIRSAQPPFQWVAHPMLAADDVCPLFVIAGAVNRNTALPVDGVRFLRHIQCQAEHTSAAETGFISVRANDQRSQVFDTEAAQTLFKSKWTSAEPYFSATDDAYYIGQHILNAELWDCIFQGKDSGEAVRNCIALGQAYVQHRRDRAGQSTASSVISRS